MTCVFQFRPFARIWLRSRTSGLTPRILGTFAAIALASSTVRLGALPQPPHMPPPVKLPEKTVTTFCPRLATCASTWDFAPLPMLTIAMTAPTPMMMPSAVRIERSLLRRRARRATMIVEPKRMGLVLPDELGVGFGGEEFLHFD